MNLTKLFEKKREEVNKQTQRLQSITTSSIVPALTSSSTVLSPMVGILLNSSTRLSTALSNDSFDSSRPISLITAHVLTNETIIRISKVIIEWLIHNKQQHHLVNMSFQYQVDFQVELNNHQNGVIV